MKFLDKWVDGSFYKDSQGRTIFYPHGAFGKGRVVPDEESETALRRFVKRIYLGELVGGLFIVFLVKPSALMFLLGVCCVAVLQLFILSRSIRKFPKSGEKLTHGEQAARATKWIHPVVHWLFLIIAIVCMLLFIPVFWARPDEWKLACVGVIFYGGLSGYIFFAIRAKQRYKLNPENEQGSKQD